jgi:hypothetical protein
LGQISLFAVKVIWNSFFLVSKLSGCLPLTQNFVPSDMSPLIWNNKLEPERGTGTLTGKSEIWPKMRGGGKTILLISLTLRVVIRLKISIMKLKRTFYHPFILSYISFHVIFNYIFVLVVFVRRSLYHYLPEI